MDEVLLYSGTIRLTAYSMWWRFPLVRWLGEKEDAAQVAYLYCLHYGLRYHDGVVDLHVYFRVLARRGVWAAVRKRQERLAGGKPEVWYETATVTPLDIFQSREPPFDEMVLDRLEVAQALGVLTPREREVVALRYGLDGEDERSYEEMGGLLGISPGTVRTLLYTAHRRLRQNFKVCE